MQLSPSVRFSVTVLIETVATSTVQAATGLTLTKTGGWSLTFQKLIM
ncbi:MAG: hypothetical protein ACTHJ7_10080 [Candidatus Nitrosocosmicus sp.]